MRQRSVLAAPLLLGSLLVHGCAGIPPLETPSGRPEILIRGGSRKGATDGISVRLLPNGWKIKEASEYVAVFGKRADSFGAAFLYGSRYDAIPEARMTFTMVDTDEGLRVFCVMEMVTNPGSAFERVSDLTAAEGGPHCQNALEEMQAEMLSGRDKEERPENLYREWIEDLDRKNKASNHSLQPTRP